MRSKFSRALIALSCLTVLGCGGTAATESTTVVDDTSDVASASELQIGGTEANFGNETLAGGFLPDPHNVNVVSGAAGANSVDIASQGLTPGNGGSCTGFATRQPDYILHFENPGEALRFLVTADEDTTLVINDGAGHWWCSDDDNGLNPAIAIPNPPAGQYDVWVGSYEAGANISGVLSVTELD